MRVLYNYVRTMASPVVSQGLEMIKRKCKSEQKRGKTWPENAESCEQYTSSQRPTSPTQGVAVCSETNWYHKVSVCHLECTSKSISCQCVIVKLSPELRDALRQFRNRCNSDSSSASVKKKSNMVLALIAPHTLLQYTNPKELREWRMQTGAESLHKHKSNGLVLHEKYFSHFYTCCGPQGVWGGSKIHKKAYINENSCPFKADFTVLILKPELTDQIKDVLTIPTLPSLDENIFAQAIRSGNHYFSLIKRDRSGSAEAHKVLLKPPTSHASNNITIEDSIQAYNETSQLQYTCRHGDSTAGAGLVYFDSMTPDNALVVTAMHLYSRRDDEVFTHCAISLPAIFHAIAGSKVCGVIPCLSLLVGACNRGHWILRFYHDLQDCLHQKNDPGDRQKRYRWTSRLLRVCDYLCRDEAQAVLRLDINVSPQIVLGSINLLSALLGCFQRVTESDGVSPFHCQINRVFLKKASERFYSGLEGLFQRLYKHLVNQSSGDDIVIGCIECWLKMCTLVGTKTNALYEVAKFTRVKCLRDSPRFRDNTHFQRLFGDLCLAFLTHTRMTVHEAVDSGPTQTQIHTLRQENLALKAEVEKLQHELSETQRLINNKDDSDDDNDVASKPFPLNSAELPEPESIQRLDSEMFWDRDMNTLLAEHINLRDTIGEVFHATDSASNGTWTHFVRHLEKRLFINGSNDGSLVKLEAMLKETVSMGERVQLVVKEWSTKETVSVGLFHNITCELGHGEQIHEILTSFEDAECDNSLVILKQNRNSRVEDI